MAGTPGEAAPDETASGDAASGITALQVLLDKQAVAEVVLRYCRGVDRLDLPAVRACYHDDAVDHHTGFDGSPDDYVAWLDVVLRRFAGTMHFVGNCFVEVDGDRAQAETYGNAHHWGDPIDDPTRNFVSGFRYVDRFERRDGAWRVAERWAVREWTRSIPADTVRPKEGVGPDPRRDRGDPVYRA